MPISWPRSALWQALLVLAVFFVGFITLSKTASGCVVEIGPDGRQLPENFTGNLWLAQNYPVGSTCGTPPPTPPPTPTPTPPTPTPTAPPSFCPGAISWHEASQHVGTQKSVKGPVARPTPGLATWNVWNVLDLGRPYPQNTFSVVISFGNPRDLSPLGLYPGQFICVTGLIERNTGWTQPAHMIEATTPSQIVIAP